MRKPSRTPSVSRANQTGSCIAVSLDYLRAIRKPSDSIYLSGAGVTYEFRKKDGKWVGEKVLEWVS